MKRAVARVVNADRAYFEALNGSGPADVPAAFNDRERAWQNASPEDREAAVKIRRQETGGAS
jgi:hypothetical protein